ncbi:hypothetical protein CVT24_013362 [Panaeolus cyanescens]|uniref:Uncharacterized protein n=1 Tax=Panaeolus cyanescens TaxID=181874 RepID=A0A409WAH3_9AGAR|nr:hypothetical protein CVT24_013362 [Panaeolus cyanescens]
MRIRSFSTIHSVFYALFCLCVALGLLRSASARPAYIPSTKHRYTSVSRQGVSGSSIPYRNKGRPLKQYNIRAATMAKTNPSLELPASSTSERSTHQRRQTIPESPVASNTITNLPSAVYNSKRSSRRSPPDGPAAPPARPS